MRLIDADALERKITQEKDSFVARDPYNTGYNNGLAMAHAMVVTTPTIDAVPVVRCKDCKYNVANMECDPLDSTDYEGVVCSYWMSDGACPTDFCSYGERRSE